MAEIIHIINKADRVYVAGEDPTSGLPITEDWHKIGISSSTAGNNKNKNDHHERTRALNQGNPRGLVVKHSRGDLANAREIEDEITKRLRARGVENLHDITGKTGHGEWWKLNEEEARQIIDEVVDEIGISKEEEQRKKDLGDDIFNRIFGG